MQDNIGDKIEVDINDAFEEILFSEEKLRHKGYKKGFAIGSSEDNIEGYHLGYHRGAEIGSELGYYKAFVNYYLDDEKKIEFSEKVLKHLETLKEGLNNFPRFNTEQEDLFILLEGNRALYKKICAQLKIKLDSKHEGLNF